MDMKFTDNFIELYEQNNVNQLDFAEKLGINQSQISRYLKGVIPDIKNIVKICDYFNVSIDIVTGLVETKTYAQQKKGFTNLAFYNEYDKLLKQNNTTHYKLAQKHLVCETSLRLWKKGTLPKFEVLYNIAYELGGSIDKLLGRI